MPKLDIGADLVAMAERIAARAPHVTAEIELNIAESRMLYVLCRALLSAQDSQKEQAEEISEGVDVEALMEKLSGCGSEAMLRAVLSVADKPENTP